MNQYLNIRTNVWCTMAYDLFQNITWLYLCFSEPPKHISENQMVCWSNYKVWCMLIYKGADPGVNMVSKRGFFFKGLLNFSYFLSRIQPYNGEVTPSLTSRDASLSTLLKWGRNVIRFFFSSQILFNCLSIEIFFPSNSAL